MTTLETIEVSQKFLIGNYRRYPVSLVRGEGSYVWDAEGKRYLDFFPGWGCAHLGHCPPKIVKAVQEQVAKLIHVPNTWYMEPQALLGKAIVEKAGIADGQCFFCNSGTEANEAVIKIARLSGKATGRYKILTMLNSFHGRTYGALSATGQAKYHEGVSPMLPGFDYAPFGDLEEARRRVSDETCAIMLEPIQGEGGINLPPAGYLEGLRALCDERKMMLIFDEVQTGMGRTGSWFAFQEFGVEPDAITLAKALAGGVACGGLLAKRPFAEKLVPGTHAATFGGNPIACVASLATMETIEKDKLLANATKIGETFRARFEAIKKRCPLIQDIRVRGCMIGVELAADGAPIVDACLKRQLLINCTHGNVLRLLPALNLSNDQIKAGCDILEEVLLAHQA